MLQLRHRARAALPDRRHGAGDVPGQQAGGAAPGAGRCGCGPAACAAGDKGASVRTATLLRRPHCCCHSLLKTTPSPNGSPPLCPSTPLQATRTRAASSLCCAARCPASCAWVSRAVQRSKSCSHPCAVAADFWTARFPVEPCSAFPCACTPAAVPQPLCRTAARTRSAACSWWFWRWCTWGAASLRRVSTEV